MLTANQELGSAAGVAVLGAVFFGRFDHGDALVPASRVLAVARPHS